ncbi:MAG: hypothetical protein LBU89_00325 [Fibromonadaceae bacterium]|jgi:hypothetical protein|nr:hypothetical protein [Fibromonadaceae bacterium]
MKIYPFLFLLFCAGVFAQINGLSYWWQSDGFIDYEQMVELDALSEDQELWCALAELYVGRELAEEAECVFVEIEPAKKAKAQKKQKKMWKAGLTTGANLDTAGNLKNKSAKVSGAVWKFSGEARVKENDDIKGTAAFRHGFFYAKGGDLTSKNRGVLSEFNFGDLRLGGQCLFKEERDSSWAYGRFSKNFMEKRFYAGGNFRMVAPYYGGNRMWSRTWQGVRFEDWNLRVTEIAVAKEDENTLDFSFLAERKRKGARLALEHTKNKSAISAGFKPVIKGTDSLWAKSEHPLRLRLGWDKKMQNVRVSHSLLFKETWEQGKPLEFRSESKIKIPLVLSPNFTTRWTANFYKDSRIDLRQFYIGLAVSY